MDMCYDGTLVMPSSYAMMEEDEMCYVDGGGTAIVYDTAGNIRSRLTKVIGLTYAGTVAAAIAGGLIGSVGGPVGAAVAAAVAGVVANVWFGAVRTCSSNAYNQVSKIITKYGTSKNCVMTTTYSFAYHFTEIEVKVK